jgi:hypothetical protein
VPGPPPVGARSDPYGSAAERARSGGAHNVVAMLGLASAAARDCLWSVLRRHINKPVSNAIRASRQAANGDLAERLRIDVPISSGAISVPVLDNSAITEGSSQEVRDHGLLVLHKQLWSPMFGAA